MKLKQLKRFAGLFLAGLMVFGVVLASPSDAAAQRRGRVIIVRPIHRPFGFGHRGFWGYDPWGYYPPYGYRQYVFDNTEKALNQGYKDGLKTGKSDGKKAKSYDPQRSHYYHDAGFGNYAEVYRSGFSRGYRDGYSEGGYGRG